MTNSSELWQTAATALSRRLDEQSDITPEEVSKISALESRLFPKSFQIDEKTGNIFRSLCTLSQLELRPAREIRSHRPVIGPVIVFLKKLSWPLISVHLKHLFESIQEFASWVVVLLAKQEVMLTEKKQSPLSLNE